MHAESYADGLLRVQWKPFNPKLNEALKKIPGATYIGDGYWVFPSEMIETLELSAKKRGYNLTLKQPKPKIISMAEPSPQLYPFQRDAVCQAIKEKRLIIGFDMGLGKTFTAIEVIRCSKAKKTLIVCPAAVRTQWVDMFEKHWPSCTDVQCLVKARFYDPKDTASITVISYDFLTAIKLPVDLDVIVFDELHYLQHYTSQRSEAAAELVDSNSEAIQIGLTGTLITTEPKGIYNPLNLLWNRRFGGFKKFANRYFKKTVNDFGYDTYKGINPHHEKELCGRLAAVSVQASKTEHAHLLPKIITDTYVVENTGIMICEAKSVDDLLQDIGVSKIDAVLDLASKKLVDHSHIHIVCYYLDTVREYDELLTSYDIPHVTICNETVRKRNNLIAQASSMDSCILLTSLKAVSTGIDSLTYNTAVICAEMYKSPGVMAQMIGRYGRLGSTTQTEILFVVMEGTHDEAIAAILMSRIDDMNKLIKIGASAESLGTALQQSKKSEEDLLKELDTMFGGF